MVDDTTSTTDTNQGASAAAGRRPRRAAVSRPAGPPAAIAPAATASSAEAATKDTAKKDTAKKTAKKPAKASAKKAGTKKSAEKAGEKSAEKTGKKATAKKAAADDADKPARTRKASAKTAASTDSTEAERAPVPAAFAAPLFQAPVIDDAAKPKRSRKKASAATESGEAETTEASDADGGDESADGARRRRRRGGRGRRKRTEGDESGESSESGESTDDDDAESSDDDSSTEGGTRRRRRRRRRGEGDETSPDDPPNTVVRVREPRSRRGRGDDDLTGSTRLEAKKQRRREGREAGRRRAPILTEAEFLARREAVDRTMVVRQVGDRTQIAVLEDDVLVEHYVTRGSNASMVGNVYLGRVQNVLPSMEAAFVDIGRGRNAVLYAGEVNWDAAGLEGQPKLIELALKSGDPVLVQVTKDPVGQKGARLTSQISLPGRFLVYVPDGSMTGISRKLPDTERSRLKGILKGVMPEGAGVIVRTAAEGAPQEALEEDVRRLAALWDDIQAKAKTANPPSLLSSEPDLAIKVVRDIFNEDVKTLIVSGDQAWETLHGYVAQVAPDLADRLQHYTGTGDVFDEHRIDEQLAKALDRKVYLPSGGSLVIDRTEAMTVIDVNTGKFTGQGGNLEQTVTRNNIEAAEEIVRQLRLRDIGGIIVVDFIDMVLESNRELVLRRLVECLGRDRTKHQVAEVTSLGLVQMTRKRIGSGLLESFSTPCEHCGGRGVRVSLHGHDHDAGASPKQRRPANAVDPADVAARALAHADEDGIAGEAAAVARAIEADIVALDGAADGVEAEIEAEALEAELDAAGNLDDIPDITSEEAAGAAEMGVEEPV